MGPRRHPWCVATLSGVLSLCGAGLSGCGTKASEAKGQEPALVINDLTLSAGELQQEQALAAATSREPRTGAAGEEPEWLSRLIERELLVQEAQRLGLDRQPDFMRTIERFWKEALIKQLLDRQARAISAATHIYEPEIEAYYARMDQEVRARIMSVRDEAHAKQLASAADLEAAVASAADLEAAVASAGPALLADSGWQWYGAETLEPPAGDIVLTTPAGEASAPLAQGGQWIVVAVAERRPREREPFATVREEIRRLLRERKEAHVMERWVADLKAHARIAIDHEAMAELP